MTLATTYLGLHLPHPFMAGASPLVDNLDTVRRLEDAGSAAIVLPSLCEERVAAAPAAAVDAYLDRLRRIKDAVKVPVIGSLNGTGAGSWIEGARLIEAAGADALELNLFDIPIDPEDSATRVEDAEMELVRAVVASVRIPVAVKLSPFYTSIPHFAARLDEAGAEGLVLFNRFGQVDIDPETLAVRPVLHLSDSTELPLRLRWLAILWRRIHLPLAVSGGVHTAVDAVKAVMAGATAVQVVSGLLRHGPRHLTVLVSGFADWLAQHRYESIDRLRGTVSLLRCPDPEVYNRLSYLPPIHGIERR